MSAGCFAATHVVHHHLQHGNPATAVAPIAKTFGEGLLRFVMVPGPVGEEWVLVLYPFLPWLAM